MGIVDLIQSDESSQQVETCPSSEEISEEIIRKANLLSISKHEEDESEEQSSNNTSLDSNSDSEEGLHSVDSDSSYVESTENLVEYSSNAAWYNEWCSNVAKKRDEI